MCNLLPITKVKCPQGRAGIVKFWAIPSVAVQQLTFDLDGIITDIQLDCLALNEVGWISFEFQKDTAFFNQEKSRNGDNVFVTQTLSFNESIMNPTTRKALKVLNGCCSLHIVVLDNSGKYHYAGISVFENGDWQSEDMNTGDGTGNTGADSTADQNEYIETITAVTSFYAPFLAADPIGISTDCSGAMLFGTSPDGDTAFGTIAGGDTAFGTIAQP